MPTNNQSHIKIASSLSEREKILALILENEKLFALVPTTTIRSDPWGYFAILNMDPNTEDNFFDTVLREAFRNQYLILYPDLAYTKDLERLLIAYNALSDLMYRRFYGYVETSPYYLSYYRSPSVRKLSFLEYYNISSSSCYYISEARRSLSNELNCLAPPFKSDEDKELSIFLRLLISHLDLDKLIELSSESIAALRAEVNKWISKYIDTILLPNALYSFLMAIAAVKPINDIDPFTQDVIDESRRIVTSDGYHFDAESLIKWILSSKQMINPFTRTVFSENDQGNIINYAAKKHLRLAPVAHVPGAINFYFFRSHEWLLRLPVISPTVNAAEAEVSGHYSGNISTEVNALLTEALNHNSENELFTCIRMFIELALLGFAQSSMTPVTQSSMIPVRRLNSTISSLANNSLTIWRNIPPTSLNNSEPESYVTVEEVDENPRAAPQ